MRRILLLITDLKIGGTPTVVRELALRLHQTGAAYVEVACLAPWGPVADQIAAGGICVSALNARGTLSLPLIVYRLARLIREHKIDIVFSFLVHANAVAAAASPLCPGVRWLQSIQTTQPTPRWHWRVQAIAGRWAEKIIVPSESAAAVARDWARTPAGKIIVIPNAVSVAEKGTKASVTTPSGHKKIGFIGRLDPVKRVADLIEAMQWLDPAIELHIFGEGAERANLEQAIARLGLTSRVTLHGQIVRPEDALTTLDLLVLPSIAEGFGLVLIEAMAAGVPVVATDVPGIRDVVRHNETGVLVPVASPRQLAEAIAELLSDPVRRAALTARAAEDVRRRFSWERVLPMYRDVLGL